MRDPVILQLSEYAKNRMLLSRGGKIHSVYRKTINIHTSQGLLAIQGNASPLSPISLITNYEEEDFCNLFLDPGIPVVFSENMVDILSPDHRVCFSLENAQITSLRITKPIPNMKRQTLKEKIWNVIIASNSHGFDRIFQDVPDEELSLMFQVVKKRILLSKELFFLGKQEESAEELSHLLGLGIGLTPSGDDFLCGILASLFMTDQMESAFAITLEEQISSHLKDTIDISAAFLTCALEGQYSTAVNSLYSNPKKSDIQKAFSDIGHSSGMDTLCGIWFGLFLFSEGSTL